VTFLLDTNVVSEWVKPQPNPSVVAWLADVDEDRTFISVITLAELRSGVAALAVGRRRDRLEVWLAQELPTRFEGRVLPVDLAVADAWGRITASAKATGRSIRAMDAFLAATAHVHQLTLVTRDVQDFQGAGTPVLCPWSGRSGD
jgi:predicted nucleic acid-binding protein